MANQHNSPWTPERVQEAARLWAELYTPKQIVEHFGGIFTVRAIEDKARHNRDLFPKRGVIRQSKFDLQKAADLWNSDMTSFEVAAALGVNPSYVRLQAQKHRDLFKSKAGKDRSKRERKPKPKTELDDVVVPATEFAPSGTWKAIELDEYEVARLPGVSMFENEGCKYPLTEDGPHSFCGCKRYQMKPYCAYHVVKTRGRGTESERAAVRVAMKVA